MLAAHLSPLATSVFSLIAIASLLLAFVMLGSRWLRHYLYAFTAESWLIGILSASFGYYGNYPELYLIAILTFDNMAAVQAAFGSAEGKAAAGDVGNFATGGADIVFFDTKDV